MESKTLKTKRAQDRVTHIITWVLINASIRRGEFRQILLGGGIEKSRAQVKKGRQKAQAIIKQLFTSLPEPLVKRILLNFEKEYHKLLDKAEAQKRGA